MDRPYLHRKPWGFCNLFYPSRDFLQIGNRPPILGSIAEWETNCSIGVQGFDLQHVFGPSSMYTGVFQNLEENPTTFMALEFTEKNKQKVMLFKCRN